MMIHTNRNPFFGVLGPAKGSAKGGRLIRHMYPVSELRIEKRMIVEHGIPYLGLTNVGIAGESEYSKRSGVLERMQTGRKQETLV
jgi:hypothetical protein